MAVNDSEVNEASTNCDVIGKLLVGVVVVLAAAVVEMWPVNVAGCRWLALVADVAAACDVAAPAAAVMGNVIVVARRSATLTPDISSISQPN